MLDLFLNQELKLHLGRREELQLLKLWKSCCFAGYGVYRISNFFCIFDRGKSFRTIVFAASLLWSYFLFNLYLFLYFDMMIIKLFDCSVGLCCISTFGFRCYYFRHLSWSFAITLLLSCRLLCVGSFVFWFYFLSSISFLYVQFTVF